MSKGSHTPHTHIPSRTLIFFRLGPFGAFSELQLLGLAALRLPFLSFLIILSPLSAKAACRLERWGGMARAGLLFVLVFPLLSSLSSPSPSSPLLSPPLLSSSPPFY